MGGETEGPPPPLTVLVADPSPDNADSLAWVFRACGHSVRTAGTAARALAAAKDQLPDVIVFEAVFPDGNAFELCPQLRTGRPGRPLLVLVSGRAVPQDAVRAAGIDAYYLKPADPAALIELLAAHARKVTGGP